MSYTDRLGNIRLNDGSIAIPAPRGYDSGTVLKPLTREAAIIENTSPGDMLLFIIALNRREQDEKKQNESLTASGL